MGEINTGCCWNKFSEFKSLESSFSVQRIEGGQGYPGRTRKTTGQPDEACGRYRSSSVLPDRFPPVLSQDWWYAFSASVLIKTGLAQSRLFIIELFPHKVYARQTITKFLIAELMLLSKSSLSHFNFDLLLTLCYVMLATSSSLSLTPLTYLAGRL